MPAHDPAGRSGKGGLDGEGARVVRVSSALE